MTLKPLISHPPAVPIAMAYARSEGAVSRGLSRDVIFREALVDPKTQTDVSFAQLVLLYLISIKETDDKFGGLGRRSFPPSQIVLMLRVMMGCDTLECALRSLARFHETGQSISIGLRIRASEAELCVFCDDALGGENAPAIEDIYISTLFGGLSYFLGRRFPVTAIVTRNRAFASSTRHWSIAVPLHLGPVAAIRFSRSLLAERRQGIPTDDIWWAVLECWLSHAHGVHTRVSHCAASIRQLNTTALCDELGISPATFRRKNSASGGTFRHFREETLVRASLSLLADGSRSISSIAAELGYADVRSYRRFIKGATGLTPDQLRTNSDATSMGALEPEVIARIMGVANGLSR
ncbi:helix-turn-helix domain-containing protein [Paraburkholderia sp. J12]|uniref:helix-turn-helix domain-containing protein n=1 Tax=Paraburkholderia sp. J12 TaxID=2805432 RepID=UPI002ABD54D4|nr:helix-turn-helix domain-containing protein [Paraburkholderia sp. J12]